MHGQGKRGRSRKSVVGRSKQFHRCASSALLGCCALAWCSGAHAQVASTWNGGSGNWSAAGSWTPNGAPNSGNADVYVDAGNPTNSTVNIDGNFTVGRLTIDAGDSVSVNNGIVFTVANGSFTGSGTFTNNGTFTLGAGPNNTDFQIMGPVTIDGTGTINLSNSINNRFYASDNASTLTIGSSQTIAGSGQIGVGAMSVINNGTFIADQANPLILQPNGSGGNFTNNSSGVLEAASGGTLQLNGGSFVNNGVIEALDASTVLLNGASISGGSFATVGSGVFVNVSSNTTLINVTNNGSFIDNNNVVTNLSGTLTNNGSMLINGGGNNTDVQILGAATINGSGTINLSNTTNNRFYASNSVSTLTIGSSQTIAGAGQIGVGGMSLINNGTIIANQSNALIVQPMAAAEISPIIQSWKPLAGHCN